MSLKSASESAIPSAHPCNRGRRHIFQGIRLGFLAAAVVLQSSVDPGFAAPTRHAFPITSVQLFSDQALVSRSGPSELKPGLNRISIEDLPGGLKADSVRITLRPMGGRTNADGSATRGLRIRGIEIETDHREVFLSAEAETAEKRLRLAEGELRRLSDAYRALREEEAQLRKIAPGQRRPETEENGGKQQLSPQAWAQTLDFLQSSLKKNHRQSQALLGKIDSAREELSVALFIANRYRSAKAYERKRVRIEIVSERKAAGRFRLELAYRIPGAAWFPVYTARVRETQVRLIGEALYRNETGEDWRDARLSFSAANPGESARLPRLNSWRIESQLIATNNHSLPDKRSQIYEEEVADEANESRAPLQEQRRTVLKPEKSNNYIGLRSEDRLRQQRLDLQTNRSKGYIQSNMAEIKDRRANKRSQQTGKALNDFEQNIKERDNAWNRKDFPNALKYSERVLENIQRLDGRHQRLFAAEQQRSEQLKRRSLEMREKRALIARLIPPARSARGYDHSYTARGHTSARSDGTLRKAYLFEKNMEAELLYEAAVHSPIDQQKSGKASALAFLTGRVKYTDSVPLLAGPVSVFHDRDYVGDAVLENVSKKEPFVLHLGAGEDIQIIRRTERFRDTAGLLSKSYVYKNEITITVRNRKQSAVTVEVFDRMPVSTDERIDISAPRMQPAPAEYNQKRGLLRFRLNLRAGEEQQIKIRYELSHPEGVLPRFRQTGGPRW